MGGIPSWPVAPLPPSGGVLLAVLAEPPGVKTWAVGSSGTPSPPEPWSWSTLILWLWGNYGYVGVSNIHTALLLLLLLTGFPALSLFVLSYVHF